MIRLFVALEIPEAIRTRLALLEGGVPGARWASEEQMHLTLRFIGEVDENVANDIDDALSGIRAPGFTLELAGVGEFGGKKPHALWAGVRGSEALLHLQRKIQTALQRIGLPPEERKFSAHVTLARIRSAPQEKVIQFIAQHALFASGPFNVDRFVLFSSQLGSGGSVYHAERTYPLT
jgi:2'-5' RNA ligase